ncbi:MAG: ribosome assembly factor SBDS [Candidatus Anstonellales archaeon]
MDLNKAIIGRIVIGGEHFEVLLDPDKTYAYLEGTKKDLNNILVVEEVYKNFKKGERQSPSNIKKAFGTDDIQTILKTILEKGEVQLTTEQRRKMVEKKRKQIIDFLAKNCIDGQTNLPIPPLRIENAMNNIKYNIDPFKPVEQQAKEILEQLRKILPIKMASVIIEIRVPADVAYKVYGYLKSLNPLKLEESNDGSIVAHIELLAGLQGEFYDRLNKLSGGKVESKLLKVKD